MLQDVLLKLIAINPLVIVERYHIVKKQMVLQPTVLPANVDQLNVHLVPVSIVSNLLADVLIQ